MNSPQYCQNCGTKLNGEAYCPRCQMATGAGKDFGVRRQENHGVQQSQGDGFQSANREIPADWTWKRSICFVLLTVILCLLIIIPIEAIRMERTRSTATALAGGLWVGFPIMAIVAGLLRGCGFAKGRAGTAKAFSIGFIIWCVFCIVIGFFI